MEAMTLPEYCQTLRVLAQLSFRMAQILTLYPQVSLHARVVSKLAFLEGFIYIQIANMFDPQKEAVR